MEQYDNLLTAVVADDEPELLNAVCQLIDWESIGFRLVGKASNGLDALQLVEAVQPDFLLTDIRMPFISGTALAQQVRTVQPLIQVAFLSGYDDFEYARQGIENEVIAYLLKPISMQELTQELKKLNAKIRHKLDELCGGGSANESRQLAAAAMLLDSGQPEDLTHSLAQLRELGVEIGETDAVRAAVVRVQAAEVSPQALLSAAEQTLSKACACCGVCLGERAALLLSSGTGFSRVYTAVDELRQTARRLWQAELLIGISKEFPSPHEAHAAYADAMQALQIAARHGGLCASEAWDNMDVLCARTTQIIEKEYMDESLTLQSVADRLHVSANYLGANIKKYAGDTFMNLLIRKRMQVAENLLLSGDSRILEVARRCGYSDQSYFGYCFKKYYGVSPARLRQESGRRGTPS